MDLARKILMEIEAREDADGARVVAVEIDGHSQHEIAYHVKLLSEAGLVEASEFRSSDGLECVPFGLTWSGHEFIDEARKDSLWQKAKKIVLEKTGGLTFEGLKIVLTQLIRDSLSGS